ncbi:MAG: hypothetical protein IEMM0008_1873 [bacterium]|nr:MAG: hypothetical protein IEMM0008_1873 [bacterium]
MTNEELIEFWITSSDHDYATMEHLFQSGDYNWSLFIGHLVIEKLLKGYYVKSVDRHVPITHNLLWIAGKTDLSLTDEQIVFLDTTTDFNVKVRYDDEQFKFYQKCTKEFAEGYIDKMKEFRVWIKEKLSN